MDIAVPNKKLKMDSSDATIPSVASLLARIAELEQELVQTKLVHQAQVFKPRCNGLDRKPSSITGRTQINESFLKAAMRETIEESGVVVTPLPLLNWTRANPEDDGDATQTNGSSRQKSPPVVQACPDKQVVSDTLNNEFIGVVEYMDPQVSTPNTHKSIYYFAASFDVEAHEAGTEGKCYEESSYPVPTVWKTHSRCYGSRPTGMQLPS
ncbi:hypothetical protein MCOR02_000901 [Pyricularia oryzae]|nr:hypothetical protein MCOR02_000901 [Pyricularia oryzae]